MKISAAHSLLACTLALAWPAEKCFADDAKAMRIDLESRYGLSGSGAGSLELGAAAGEFDVRIQAEGDGAVPSLLEGDAKASVALPYLVAGAAKPVGLAAFMRRPTSAGPILTGLSVMPLAIVDPGEAPWAGACLGGAAGVMAVSPRSEPETMAACAWMSPFDGRLSMIVGLADLPAEKGGPAWSDAPTPASRRAWSGMAAAAGGAGWKAAAAGTASASFPGSDAAALRVEGALAGGGVRVEAEASATFGEWLGLTGDGADVLRAGIDARLARRGSAIGMAATLAVDEWDQAADFSLRGSAEAEGGFGGARARLEIGGKAGEPATFELSTSFRPGFARWISFGTRWLATELKSALFELESSVRLPGPVSLAVGAGMRFVPEGRLVNLDLDLGAMIGKFRAGIGVGTDGWTEPSLLSWDRLEYRLSARLRVEGGASLYRGTVSRYSLGAGADGGDEPPDRPVPERSEE